MGTDKPKIQGYILPLLHERFEEWKRDRGITKDSQALNQLFEEFFGVAPDATAPQKPPLEEKITCIVEKRLAEVRSSVGSLSEQLKFLTQAVLGLQSTGQLPSTLTSELAESFPILDAIALAQAQAKSKSLVNQSELSASTTEKLKPKLDESPSNLLNDLSMGTEEIHIELVGELPSELQSELLN